MKRILCLLVSFVSYFAFAQTVTLTFTGVDQLNDHVQLDSVAVTNLTRGWQEVIYYPDTILQLTNGVGIEAVSQAVFANITPNPFDGTSVLMIQLSKADDVKLQMLDMQGRSIAQWSGLLGTGCHEFDIALATPQIYALQITTHIGQKSMKMINKGNAATNHIEYKGLTNAKSVASQSSKPFVFGDFMEYVGYATFNGNAYESTRINIQQGTTQTHVLQFPFSDYTPWDGTGTNPNDGMACHGMPTLTDYDGNTYLTVQIGSQCWMRENLATSHYSNGEVIPLGTTESSVTYPYRYCPGNDSNNVSYHGYYYNWTAIMHGAQSSNATPSGVQGICPTGWHLPSNAEWTELSDYVGAQMAYQCGGYSGNITKAISTAKDWIPSNETCATGFDLYTNNSTGFSALPSGGYSSQYDNFGNGACFWSCTSIDSYYARGRSWYYYQPTWSVTQNGKNNGRSVRCLMN